MPDFYVESYFENAKEVFRFLINHFIEEDHKIENQDFIINEFNNFIDDKNNNLKCLGIFLSRYKLGYAWEIKDSLKTSFMKDKRIRKRVLENVTFEIARSDSILVTGSLNNNTLKELKNYIDEDTMNLIYDRNYSFLIKNYNHNGELNIYIPMLIDNDYHVHEFIILRNEFIDIYSRNYPRKEYCILIDVSINNVDLK